MRTPQTLSEETGIEQAPVRRSNAGRTARYPAGVRMAARVAGFTAATVLVGSALAACSTDQAVCGGGEYPVQAVGSTGNACVEKGKNPPKDYVRYPEGKVPEKVDDKWQKYWSTHIIEKDGSVREAREGE